MKQTVLVIAVFCALSVHAVPTGNIDLGSIISPIFTAKTGLLSAAQKGINSQFDQVSNRLDSISSSFSGGLGGGSSGGFNPLTIVHTLLRSIVPGSSSGASSNHDSSSLDFQNDNSFSGGSTYDSSSAGGLSSGGFEQSGGYSQTQQFSSAVQDGTQYSADSGYVYQRPPPPITNGGSSWSGSSSGGVSSGGSSIGESSHGSSGISGHGSSGSSSSGSSGHGGLAGLSGIIGTIGQIPVQLLTTSKDRINSHFDRKIETLNKFSGSFSNSH